MAETTEESKRQSNRYTPALTMTASPSVRTNLALPHLLGAARFARQAYLVEQENVDKPFGVFFDELVQLVMATVTLSVACLEAFINEMFADAPQRLPSFSKEVLEAVWELAEQRRVLDKYDLALTLQAAQPFNKQKPIYQNVEVLVDFRNALIHFKPEWVDDENKDKLLSKKLENKFKPSPFLPPNEPLYPMACMSHECAEWAVKSVVDYLTIFQERTKMKPKIDPSNSGLRTR